MEYGYKAELVTSDFYDYNIIKTALGKSNNFNKEKEALFVKMLNRKVGGYKMITGKEPFELNGKSVGFTMLDFWKFEFSNVYDLQDEISEFIVAKALNIDVPHNKDMWTLFDILYRDIRIEVKETSYYHPWNEDGKISKHRAFGITKANSAYEYPNQPNRYERQNDIYVFCVVNGETRATANPLILDNWDFYVVPTTVINEKCKENKTISLNRLHSLNYRPVRYNELKCEIDRLADEIKKQKSDCNNKHSE